MTELSATHVLEFPGGYTRSTGTIIGTFLGGLRDERVLGTRVADGRVIVPPLEYDPDTNVALTTDAFVEVGTEGEIVTWAWQGRPRDGQPSSEPFAFALIKLDGADTPMLHGVRAADASAVSTGARVRAVWAAEKTGTMHDLSHFELVDQEA